MNAQQTVRLPLIELVTSTCATEEQLVHAAAVPNPAVRSHLLARPDLPLSVQRVLAASPDVPTRLKLVASPATCAEVLGTLAHDPVPAVASAAQKALQKLA